jgi:hypothetical protein
LPEATEDFAPDFELAPIAIAVTLPPAPRPPAPPKAATTKPPPATAEPIVTAPTVAPTPVSPKPITIITADERRKMNKEIDDILEKVKRVLDRTAGRNLPSELASLATQARSFAEQAEQARDKDLLTAVSHAKRAEFFANDLNSRLP